MAAPITKSPNIAAKEILSDEKFPIRNKSIHLSVEIRESELLACLLDKHSNRYIAFAVVPLNDKENSLTNALKDDFFASSISDITVVFTPNSSVLVPSAFYKKDLINDYLATQQLTKENETPCSDYIKSLDCYSLYTVNSQWLSIIKEVFPNVVLRHHSSQFIESVLIENKNEHEDKVFVSIFNKYIDVIALQSGRLKLYNRFYYENSSDFLYYLLWVYEQLGLDTEKVSCVFYGDTDIEKLEAAGKYIRKVITGYGLEESGFSAALAKLPYHKYRSLFTQYLYI